MKISLISIKRIFISCLLLPLLPILAACGSDEIEGYSLNDDDYYINDSSVAAVLILGNHANAMAVPDDAYAYLETALDHTVYGGYACAIISDSTPTKVELVEDGFFAEDARNPRKLSEYIDQRKRQLIDSLRNLTDPADSPETDLLAAIREATNVLTGARASNIPNKQIIIIDTGISTVGDLSLVEMDFLNEKPEADKIINQLKSYEGVGVLPDLIGISVIFIGTSDGLAETAAPQLMTTTDRIYIKNLWESVVRACGADDVQFVSAAGWDTPNVYTEDAASKFPYVSVIAFHHERIINFAELASFAPNNPDPQPNMPDPPVVSLKFESQTIGFKPDTAVYQNENTALSTLKPYASDLQDYFTIFPDEKIWIIGTSATTQKDSDGSVELSLQRAETVKKTLTALGVPEDSLLTIGLGARFPWHVDEFPSGSFDTVIAQENRAVWILNTSSENDKFNMLRSAYENDELLPEARERFSQFY